MGIEFTDEFEEWWHTLSEYEQGKVDARVTLLMEFEPNLGFPFSSQVKTSRFAEMRELRAQTGGDPLRMLYTLLILGELPFFCSAATKAAVTVGMKYMFQ